MDETTTILLPCPFCGGHGEPRHAAGGRQNWIECTAPLCHGMGANLASAREAAIAWNRRALVQPALLGVEELYQEAHRTWQAHPGPSDWIAEFEDAYESTKGRLSSPGPAVVALCGADVGGAVCNRRPHDDAFHICDGGGTESAEKIAAAHADRYVRGEGGSR